MKKRLTVILSLIMAFVLCFALVACGGDKGTNKPGPGPGPGPGPEEPDNTVSITLNDAIDAIDGVLNAHGITGTATYKLSTKNTEAITDSISFDKRGNKIKVTAGREESIIDLATGYVYYKSTDGYTFDHEFYANEIGYIQHVLSGLKQADATHKIKATYDEEAKTITLVEDLAEGFNKYLAPLQDAYKDKASLGELLDEYCDMFFGKSFDEVYTVIEDFVKDTDNTIGTLIEALEIAGVDVEAILEMTGLEMSEQELNAIKARPLDQVVAGASNYIMAVIENMMPAADDGDDDEPIQGSTGDGMESLAMGLLQAMLFDDVSEEDVAAGLQGIKGLIGMVQGFKVDALIDMALKDVPQVADLYTVIKDNVRLENATVTITLTQDDDKNITGIKVDCIASHTYEGEATEGSFLADNDYSATAEIKIDEYKSTTEDFVIQFAPNFDYKMPVTALLYEVTDKDVSVYFETAGNTVTVGSYILEWVTPSGEVREIQPEDEDVFRFDAATSSFVFDSGLIQDVFSDAVLGSYLQAGYSAFGTSLNAIVFFDDDEDGYEIKLTYVTDDWDAIYDYAYNMAMDMILDFIGGSHEAPEIKSTAADGEYRYFKDNGELDDSYYWVIEDGEIVTCIFRGDDLTEYAEVYVYETDSGETGVDIIIETADYQLVMLGTVKENYIQIEMQIMDDGSGDEAYAHDIMIMYRGDEGALTDYDGKYIMYDDEVKAGNTILIIGGEVVCITDGGYVIADACESVIEENEIIFDYQSGDWSFLYTGTIEDGVITFVERYAYQGDELKSELDEGEVIYYVRGGGQPNTAMYA